MNLNVSTINIDNVRWDCLKAIAYVPTKEVFGENFWVQKFPRAATFNYIELGFFLQLYYGKCSSRLAIGGKRSHLLSVDQGDVFARSPWNPRQRVSANSYNVFYKWQDSTKLRGIFKIICQRDSNERTNRDHEFNPRLLYFKKLLRIVLFETRDYCTQATRV